jgi:hypothetical protein
MFFIAPPVSRNLRLSHNNNNNIRGTTKQAQESARKFEQQQGFIFYPYFPLLFYLNFLLHALSILNWKASLENGTADCIAFFGLI